MNMLYIYLKGQIQMTKILYLPSTWAIDYLTWAEQAQVDVNHAGRQKGQPRKGCWATKTAFFEDGKDEQKRSSIGLNTWETITILVCHHQHIIHADHPTTLTTLTLFPSADHLDHQDQLDHLIHPDPEQQFAKFAKPFFLEQKLSWTKNCKKNIWNEYLQKSCHKFQKN